MTEEQIKRFPKSAEEYFHKQSKDGIPWKTEIYQFFEVINFYRKATNKLQEENNNINGIIISQGSALEKEYALNTYLQEENDKLKKEKIPQLERKIASIRGAHSVDCKKLNARIEQVERLKKENKILERRILRSKECMKKLLFIIEENRLNCKGLIQDAKDFIHNRICPIRKQGQHCITEEPCIMCDRD